MYFKHLKSALLYFNICTFVKSSISSNILEAYHFDHEIQSAWITPKDVCSQESQPCEVKVYEIVSEHNLQTS